MSVIGFHTKTTPDVTSYLANVLKEICPQATLYNNRQHRLLSHVSKDTRAIICFGPEAKAICDHQLTFTAFRPQTIALAERDIASQTIETLRTELNQVMTPEVTLTQAELSAMTRAAVQSALTTGTALRLQTAQGDLIQVGGTTCPPDVFHINAEEACMLLEIRELLGEVKSVRIVSRIDGR